MKISEVLKAVRKEIILDQKSFKYINIKVQEFLDYLQAEIIRYGISAELFIGGSFAKGTLTKRDTYDVDVYVRFDWCENYLSDTLEKSLRNVAKVLNSQLQRIHGSRDYFRISKDDIIFEVIPVVKITHPKQAYNVTDLSYFHVKYLKKKIKKTQLAQEIILAKRFFQAQRLYGAEGYVSGFSGYGIECLIIYYKSFLNMLKILAKTKDRIIIDIEKDYKNKNEVLFSLNESKLQSPVILVDPTWKDRNVLAALSHETFKKFQEKAKDFLKKPSREFFELTEISTGNLQEIAKRKKGDFLHIKLETDKQEGDVAGTKMKKFSRFLEFEMRKYFDIVASEFDYAEGQKSDFYLVVKPRKEFIKTGPPIKMKAAVRAFKALNKKTFVKNGYWYVKEKINFSAKEFLERWKKLNKEKIKEMGIVGMNVL